MAFLLLFEISLRKDYGMNVKIFKEKKINNNNTTATTHTNKIDSFTHTHSGNLNDSHVVTGEHTLLVSGHVHTLTPTITLYGQNLDRVTLGK